MAEKNATTLNNVCYSCVGDGDDDDDIISSKQNNIISTMTTMMSTENENHQQKEHLSNIIVANNRNSNIDHLYRAQMSIQTMYKRIQDKLDHLNNKILFSIFLCFVSFLFIIMAIVVYYSTNKESVVASVVASALFANILNLVTLCANHCGNYFIVYLYCMLTLLHILVNIFIAISFPWFFLIILFQIFAVILTTAHLRRIKREQFPTFRTNNEYL
ncbi:uncharacterized protein LOC124495406 [Dermatophagoides farinae]|uniref:Uncharacterized protein n=2 Tax=Dermatophagoides farinae TaxID=6954 RepID=A0A922LA84_DERFA|nr:hypothetical protein DERF_000490 [Dermatophagoides farinae]